MVSYDGRQTTYDAQNRQKLPGVLAADSDDVWNAPGRVLPGSGHSSMRSSTPVSPTTTI